MARPLSFMRISAAGFPALWLQPSFRARSGRGWCGDLDPAGLQRLGDLAHQVDMQHPVAMRGAGDADMVGQSEAAFEGAGGDAAMQVGAPGLLGGLLGGDDQRAVLDLDSQFIGGKARHGNRDAIGILGGLFDIVGGVGRLGDIGGQNPVHQVGDPVETNGCAVERRHINVTHSHPPLSDAGPHHPWRQGRLQCRNPIAASRLRKNGIVGRRVQEGAAAQGRTNFAPPDTPASPAPRR